MRRTVRPELPAHLSAATIRARMDPTTTVILTCGNQPSMADIELTASRNNISCEKEVW